MGCESKVDNNEVDMRTSSETNWDNVRSWGNFTHVCNDHAKAPTPNSTANNSLIDFASPMDAKSCLVHLSA